MDLRASFIEGMSRAATFVAVATTDGEGGRYGVTISSLTSVSADGDQPSLLACVHYKSPAAAAILKNRAFCANLLEEGQQEISDLFAGRSGAAEHSVRFDRAEWQAGPLGQPQIIGVVALTPHRGCHGVSLAICRPGPDAARGHGMAALPESAQ